MGTVAEIRPGLLQKYVDEELFEPARELHQRLTLELAGETDDFRDNEALTDYRLTYGELLKRVEEWKRRMTSWARKRAAQDAPELATCRRRLAALHRHYRGILDASAKLMDQNRRSAAVRPWNM